MQRASQTDDETQRRSLLTFAVVGAGPTGVEMAATLADLLPDWYAQLGGDIRQIRIVLINHGKTILAGDVNTGFQYVTAWLCVMEAAQAQAGETLLVIGATGEVGSAVTQIAKWKGLRVLGTVRRDNDRNSVQQSGVDVAINSETEVSSKKYYLDCCIKYSLHT
ncbi:MAG: hypothetical protein V7K77_10230 [Nostoc sp.]|uniref:hypothetical protein n=1 Tax=Nostoc sp. TaxID=1180 RepID=UPI002FF8E453